MDYFSRFSITFPSKTANVSDVISPLEKVFTLYSTPLAMYGDQGQHFNNQEMKDFFQKCGVSFTCSPSGASQSTGMIEVENKLLEDVLRKTRQDWEDTLDKSTRNLNSRIIGHLSICPSSILFDADPTPSTLDPILRSVSIQCVSAWKDDLLNPLQHTASVQQYLTYRVQLHNVIQQRSDAKKDKEATQFNRGINEVYFKKEDLVMLYQKNTGKLEAWWRGPFVLRGPGGDHGKSFALQQGNGRKIRGTFHGNHLKIFTPREGYLASGTLAPFPVQTIWAPRQKKKV